MTKALKDLLQSMESDVRDIQARFDALCVEVRGIAMVQTDVVEKALSMLALSKRTEEEKRVVDLRVSSLTNSITKTLPLLEDMLQLVIMYTAPAAQENVASHEEETTESAQDAPTPPEP